MKIQTAKRITQNSKFKSQTSDFRLEQVEHVLFIFPEHFAIALACEVLVLHLFQLLPV